MMRRDSGPGVGDAMRRHRPRSVGAGIAGTRAMAADKGRGQGARVCLRRAAVALACVALAWVVVLGLVRAPEVSVCVLVRQQLGLPCEEHPATTADGYTLVLKRIPREGGTPVLLLPGVADSAATFLVSGRHESLAGALHDAGMDVWLMEKRGRAPWRHDKYNGQDMEFWDFSFDEHVELDLPAMIGYVRRFTGYRDIGSVVGHSEGGMIAAAGLARDPALAKHVRSVVGMAPTLGSWQTASGVQLPQIPQIVIDNVHPGVLWGVVRVVFNGICANVPRACVKLICSASGCSGHENYDPDVVSRIFSYYPRETSLKNLQHIIQCINAGRLQRFSYGPEENMRRYGTIEPPAYNFSKFATPTALYYGSNDRFVAPDTHGATLDLFDTASAKVVNYTVPFGHADFVWAEDANTVLYQPLISFIKEHLSQKEF